jgi:hypothetical protein
MNSILNFSITAILQMPVPPMKIALRLASRKAPAASQIGLKIAYSWPM